jgi:hypothetical protein
MEKMYINSCGFSRMEPRHEYHWRDENNNRADREVEAWLKPQNFHGYSITDLIQTDSKMPSVVMARDRGKLLLLATRMMSKVRKASTGDLVSNGVLLVGDESDLKTIRILAADLLLSYPTVGDDFDSLDHSEAHGILAGEADRVTQFDDAEGFSMIDLGDPRARLSERVEALAHYPPHQRESFEWQGMIGHNCRKLRQELAYELKHFSFPKSDGALVVVTGIKSEITLSEAYAWRSLSLLADSVNWTPLARNRAKQKQRIDQEKLRKQGSFRANVA